VAAMVRWRSPSMPSSAPAHRRQRSSRARYGGGACPLLRMRASARCCWHRRSALLPPSRPSVQVEPQVAACLQGFNSTAFSYGPSGTGKSFTCYGPAGGTVASGSAAAAKWAASADAGMIPRAAEQLFASIERGGSLQHGRFLLRVSFLQLYRESLSDLLGPSQAQQHAPGAVAGSLALREDPHRCARRRTSPHAASRCGQPLRTRTRQPHPPPAAHPQPADVTPQLTPCVNRSVCAAACLSKG
jgi:hypothetical protein